MKRHCAPAAGGSSRFNLTPLRPGLRRPALGLLSFALAVAVGASERAVVRLACPLDGTEFEAVQEFSGYAEGQRLDLRKIGPISQPPTLARCPQCGFPLFTRHPDAAEAARLRALVAGERFRTEGRSAGPWFALGVLREELHADPFEIGWTYLNASWEAEDEDGDYARAAQRALAWFDRAADALRADRKRSKDGLVARYLGVELCRRLGRFDAARQRLDALVDARDSALPWLPRALDAQARRIAARDAAPDDGRAEPPRPPR
ncbi:hypothetical protein [Oleiharenicola sp. Vm1]|uniref:hypothetical protein n=1 Tax=Oleiharenicola sp. Vm1 TaxID=3398393 RepID=UPI0039F5750F